MDPDTVQMYMSTFIKLNHGSGYGTDEQVYYQWTEPYSTITCSFSLQNSLTMHIPLPQIHLQTMDALTMLIIASVCSEINLLISFSFITFIDLFLRHRTVLHLFSKDPLEKFKDKLECNIWNTLYFMHFFQWIHYKYLKGMFMKKQIIAIIWGEVTFGMF